MKRILIVALLLIAVPCFALAQKMDKPASTQTAGQHQTPTDSSMQPMFVKFKDVKWERIMPELGASSPEITFLRVDAKTKASQLMIRVPKNFHVPRHWHTANETHTILSGNFIMECEGRREELGPGSFNYIPSKMIHQAWTRPDEGTVLFITVDGAWDVNWVDGPPQAPKKEGPEALVDGFVRAFNTHSADAFGRLFSEDADWVSVAGIWVKGRADIQAEHEKAFATFFKTTTLASTGTDVRLLRQDVAVVHFNWELTGQLDREGKPRGPRRGIITIVATKQADGWRISAGQNTNSLEKP